MFALMILCQPLVNFGNDYDTVHLFSIPLYFLFYISNYNAFRYRRILNIQLIVYSEVDQWEAKSRNKRNN